MINGDHVILNTMNKIGNYQHKLDLYCSVGLEWHDLSVAIATTFVVSLVCTNFRPTGSSTTNDDTKDRLMLIT